MVVTLQQVEQEKEVAQIRLLHTQNSTTHTLRLSKCTRVSKSMGSGLKR